MSRGFEERACARSSRRTPAAMQRGGPGSETRDQYRFHRNSASAVKASAPSGFSAQSFAVLLSAEGSPPSVIGSIREQRAHVARGDVMDGRGRVSARELEHEQRGEAAVTEPARAEAFTLAAHGGLNQKPGFLAGRFVRT